MKKYTIGEISKIIGIHEQTIRTYERKKLIKIHRDKNNNRLFSKEDLLTIQVIVKLTQELGLNLAGVRIVFSLAKLQNMNSDELLDFVDDYL